MPGAACPGGSAQGGHGDRSGLRKIRVLNSSRGAKTPGSPRPQGTRVSSPHAGVSRCSGRGALRSQSSPLTWP